MCCVIDAVRNPLFTSNPRKIATRTTHTPTCLRLARIGKCQYPLFSSQAPGLTHQMKVYHPEQVPCCPENYAEERLLSEFCSIAQTFTVQNHIPEVHTNLLHNFRKSLSDLCVWYYVLHNSEIHTIYGLGYAILRYHTGNPRTANPIT